MATIQVKNLTNQSPRHIATSGNEFVEQYSLAVPAAGTVNGVDIATGDVIQLGILQAGWKLSPQAVDIVITDAFGAGVTGALGFAYVDGVDVAGAGAQDADYFMKSNALSAAAIVRGNNEAVVPVTLTKDAYLTLTLGGTSHDASAANLEVFIRGVNAGTL